MERQLIGRRVACRASPRNWKMNEKLSLELFEERIKECEDELVRKVTEIVSEYRRREGREKLKKIVIIINIRMMHKKGRERI